MIKIISTDKRAIKAGLKFEEESNKKHNFKYDYSKVIYVNSLIEVNIICPTHGGFTQTPPNHLKGHGCQKCGIDKIRKI